MELWKIFFVILACIFFIGSGVFVWHGHKAMQEGIKLQKKMFGEIIDHWSREEKSGK